MKKKILIINGPNLNLLGRREQSIYGNMSFEDYLEQLQHKFQPIQLEYIQSNHEGVLIDKLHEAGFADYQGIVMNAGAYTHTSIAISDAIRGIKTPVVEVHISDIYQRESYRHISYMKDACVHSVIGQGLKGYDLSIEYLLQYKRSSTN